MGEATIKLVRRQPRTAALLALASVLAVAAFLFASTIGRATSDDSAYTLPAVVDTNPAADIVETSITSKEATVNVGTPATPRLAHAQTLNGAIPGPTFRLKVGDTVIVHYKNELAHPSGLHWHGIELANAMDGTPFTQNQVPTGKEFLYKFTVHRPGVYWYHPHHHASTNQVFKGLYGMILVEDPDEAALIASGVLPTAAQTKPIVLSDITVCKAAPTNDTQTYATGAGVPWTGPGGTLVTAQAAPTPKTLCEAPTAIDEDGNLRPSSFAAGDVPNIQTLATAGRTNEGQTVLTNGMNVGARAGSPAVPGALAPGAQLLNVQAGQGLRLPILNASAVRYMRLRLTTSTGTLIPLVRIGGEGGLIDNAVVEGGFQGAFDTKYGAGEILLPPGTRADVVAAIPPAATGVATLWTGDFNRTGLGFANIPTVPVMHLNVSGTAVPTFTIANGTPLPGVAVATLGPATGTLLNPAAFAPPKLGQPLQDVQFTQGGTQLGINGVFGTHDVPGDYTVAPHLGSTRYAVAGQTLELTVTNMTDAHHPFHLHGFSIQPISLTRTGFPTFTWPYKEFRDNVDVPGRNSGDPPGPGYTLRFRVKLDDRALADGTTLGGALGRWVFHCHIFFHATNGMLSEIVVVPAANGNEKPDVNADVTKVAAIEGQAMSATGTYKDPDNDPVTLSASIGTVADTGGGTWKWTKTATASDAGVKFVYITATDSGGRKDEAVFALDVTPVPVAPTLTLTPATATNPVLASHTVTATLANVAPLSGKAILFSVTGAHTRSGSATTTAAGVATYSYPGTAAGSDTITACYDANANAACGGDELKATATKTWVLAAPRDLDHFKCYTVTPTRTRTRRVTLTDQFGRRSALTSARRTLCNPVSKNGGRILHRRAHLTCYTTSDRGAAMRPRRVRVVNQFGVRVLTVVRSKSLCVPSLKRIGTRAPTGSNPSLALDHFRCYDVKGQPATRTVRLRDQFGTKTTRVVRLVTLCNPVRKVKGRTVARVRRPGAHLVCYTIRDTLRRRTVTVRNQFERARLRTARSHTLCLPSLKQAL